MTEEESRVVVSENQDKIDLTEEQIKRWAGKRILCLIQIKDVEVIEPLVLAHQKNMDDWITVEQITSVLEGTNENYHSISVKD